MPTATESVAQGRQARNEGDLPAARAHYAAAAVIYREQGEVLAYAHTIRHVADIHRQESNWIDAKPLYEEALEIYRSNLDTKLLDLANTVRPYAVLLEQQGNLALAATHWEEARNLYSSLRINEGAAECESHINQLRSS